MGPRSVGLYRSIPWYNFFDIKFIFSPREILTLDGSGEISGINGAGPELWQMQFYPELFLVEANFCEV